MRSLPKHVRRPDALNQSPTDYEVQEEGDLDFPVSFVLPPFSSGLVMLTILRRLCLFTLSLILISRRLFGIAILGIISFKTPGTSQDLLAVWTFALQRALGDTDLLASCGGSLRAFIVAAFAVGGGEETGPVALIARNWAALTRFSPMVEACLSSPSGDLRTQSSVRW